MRARVVVGCGLLTCLACALPAVVLAAAPVASTSSVEVLGRGGERATIIGTVEPGGSITNAYAGYGPVGGQWCTSDGREGNPLETPLGGIAEWEGARVNVSVPIKGLEPETSYCAELVAANEDGTAYGGQLDFKTIARGSLITVPEEIPLPVKHFNPYHREEDSVEWGRIAGELRIREQHEREALEASERQAREASEREREALAVRCIVPRLKGRSVEGARRALANLHCKLGRVSHFSTRGLVVVAQTVPAGHKMPEGTAVGVRLGRIEHVAASHTRRRATARSPS
jgi:hypothetical protein